MTIFLARLAGFRQAASVKQSKGIVLACVQTFQQESFVLGNLLFESSSSKNSHSFAMTIFLARLAGFEPAASPLGGERSIHLSYKRTSLGII